MEENKTQEVIKNSKATTKEKVAATQEVKAGNIKQQPPVKKRAGLPPRLQYSINNAESNLERIKVKLDNLALKSFDDATSLERIIEVLEANETLKEERRVKSAQRKNRYKLDFEYGVYSANDVTSKSILALFRNVKRLNENQMKSIQEKFLKNDISNVVGALDANSRFATDVSFMVDLLLRKSRELSSNGSYENLSILKEIIKKIEGKDEIEVENNETEATDEVAKEENE